jgi:hypothetical protein
LRQEPTSKYYRHDVGSEGGTIWIPLKPGVYYIPNIDIPVESSIEVNLNFKIEAPGIEQKGKDLLSVSVQNVPDIKAHKLGKLKWTPKLGPEVKLGFRASARCEKEQSNESKTQTLQWSVQGQSRSGSADGN